MCTNILTPEEGNGNPLQYSCLKNPVERGAWWAVVHRVAQNRTRLKWLNMHACTGEGNDNSLQYSPGEPQGWRSLVGCRLWIAQSQTQLKRLSSSSSILTLREIQYEIWSLFLKNLHLTTQPHGHKQGLHGQSKPRWVLHSHVLAVWPWASWSFIKASVSQCEQWW